MKINSLEQLVGLCPSVQELVQIIENGNVTPEDIEGIDAVIFETVNWVRQTPWFEKSIKRD